MSKKCPFTEKNYLTDQVTAMFLLTKIRFCTFSEDLSFVYPLIVWINESIKKKEKITNRWSKDGVANIDQPM